VTRHRFRIRPLPLLTVTKFDGSQTVEVHARRYFGWEDLCKGSLQAFLSLLVARP